MIKFHIDKPLTVLLALSFRRGTAGGVSSDPLLPPAPVPRSSTPFCRLLSFGGSSGGLSSLDSLGALAPGTRVSSRSRMASRSGPLSSNRGLPSSSGLSSLGKPGNGYKAEMKINHEIHQRTSKEYTCNSIYIFIHFYIYMYHYMILNSIIYMVIKPIIKKFTLKFSNKHISA